MFHKVSSVRPLPQHRLSVLFANGEMRQYDVAPLREELYERGERTETLILKK